MKRFLDRFGRWSKVLVNTNLFSMLLLVVFLVGFWVVKEEIYSLNKERLIRKFEVDSKTVVVNMESMLKEYSDLLYTMRGFIMASEEVTRVEWREFANNVRLKEDYSSVTAVEFLRRVSGESIESFQDKVNASLIATGDKRIFKVSPSGDRKEYYVVDFIEPYIRNEKVWGYDMYSDASRRKVIDLARDTNSVIMSEPVILVQEVEGQKGLLFMLPVYKNKEVETMIQRREDIVGMVMLSVRVSDLISTIISKETFTGLSGIVINDLSEGSETLVSVRVDGKAENEVEALDEVYKERLNYGSRIWELSFRSDKKVEVVGIDLLTPYILMIIGFIIVFFQRWQVSSVLRSEEKLANVITGSRAGTWEWNVQTGEVIFNERWAEILGYTLKELEPISIKTWEKLAMPEDLKRSDELINEHFEGKSEHYESESRMRHKNGSIVWVADRGRLISRDNKGQPLKMIGIHLDITKEREAEERLRRSREDILNLSRRNEAILFSIGDGVLACDRQGKIVIFNKMAEKLTGYSGAEAGGRHYSKIAIFIDEKTNSNIHDIVSESIEKGEAIGVAANTTLKRNDGSHLPVAVSAAPVKDANNNVMGCVVVFKDMTLQRSMDKAKTEFVMEASHHLRTPLSAINWYTQFLKDEKNGTLTKEQSGLVEEIRKAGSRMTDLTNSLLNVARLEMGSFSVEPFLVKAVEAVTQGVDVCRPEIHRKGIAFTERYEVGDQMFMADPKMLGIIVQNILGNAINYTPSGGSIVLDLKKEDGELKLIISDTGIGIPKVDQGRIYEKFYRSDNVKQINPSGMGLGLYIVKEIIEQSGGNISFLSEEGKGTTFWVTYPETGMKSVNGLEKK